MRSLLHKRTTIFFAVLIVLASLLSGLAIYNYIQGKQSLTTESTVSTMVAQPGEQPGNMTTADRHAGLEKGLTILSLVILVVLVMFMLFLRAKVIKPLHRLDELSRKMADGSFDHLAKGGQEISSYVDTIGENVNSLAMNLQEILLLVWNLSEHNLETLKKTIPMVEGNTLPADDIKKNLEEMKNELLQMQALTEQFELFDVAIKGNKALAKEDSANS